MSPIRISAATAFAGLLLLSAAEAGGQVVPAGDVSLGRVSGIVFDSLRMKGMAGATVWSETAGRTTIADSTGAFVLDSVPPGEHRVNAADGHLDSLGLTITAVLRVPPDTQALVLATPAFASLSASLCGSAGELEGSAGILFGSVRAAATGRAADSAQVDVSWVTMAGNAKGFEPRIAEVTAETDEAGNYVICGVPADTTLQIQARTPPAASSGVLYLDIGPTRVARLDLGVAPRESSAATGVVRGVVSDQEGRTLEGISVQVDGSPVESRTDPSGAFVLRNTPLGTQTLVVRRPGYAPTYSHVSVTPRDTPYVRLVMSTAQVLGAVAIRAERISRAMAEIERRRLVGLGTHFRAEQISQRASFESIFQSVAGIEVHRGRRPGEYLVTGRGGSAGRCAMSIFIDGTRADAQILAMYPMREIVAIEVYPRGGQVPPAYQIQADGCGAVLVWTTFMR